MSLPDINWIEIIGITLRFLTFLFSLIFIIRYSRRPWRSLPEGRHLMGFSCVVCAFMLWSFVNNIAAWLDPSPPQIRPDGNWPGRDYIALILFGFTAWYMYKRNTLLVPQEKLRQIEKDLNDLHDDRISSEDAQQLTEAVTDLAGAIRDDGDVDATRSEDVRAYEVQGEDHRSG